MSDEKNRIRRAIFARCRDLGLDDDERRAVGERATGKASMTKMSVGDMRKMLAALGPAGERPDLPAGDADAETPGPLDIGLLA